MGTKASLLPRFERWRSYLSDNGRAMSRENVEIVRRVFGAAARRDSSEVLALYDTEVEWDASRHPLGGVTGRLAHGRDALCDWFRDWFGAWDGLEERYDELIDAGEQVISVGSIRAQGRSSGVEVAMTGAAVWTIREGKIVRVVWFETRAEALDAAGLSE